jgi:Na+/proline symporter
MKIFFAIILFCYAGWQILTSVGTAMQYGTGQGLGQIFWALLAVLGGIYLVRKSKKQKEDKNKENL